MAPQDQRRTSPLTLHLLAGIQSGVLGGAGMIAVMGLGAIVERHAFWAIPNVLGSLFYGRDALRTSFGAPAAAGLALHFFAAGAIGALFGILTGEFRKTLRVLLMGTVTGLLWYYASLALLWRKLGVLGDLYASPQSMLLAHAVYGIVLGCYPSGLRSIAKRFLGEPEPPPATSGQQAPTDRIE
ncbi:MAG: hypothetical protein ABSG25_00455 [Bryobacteraceae bacterium]